MVDRKLLKRAIAATAAVAVLATVAGVASRVRHRELARMPAAASGLVVGTFHLHSDMSHDSSMPIAEIVEAAKADHLDFVVLADHNNQYAGPVVRDGVVVLSYAELSTAFGHVVGLGAKSVLSRDKRRDPAVLAELRALGAVPLVTHPADPKQPWGGSWDRAGGLEIANFASSARRYGGRGFVGLAPLLAGGLLNRGLALAQVYDRDVVSLALWDKNPDPRFTGACGVDAHGWMDLGDNLLAWTLVTPGPLPADEAARPAWILDRLESGRFACSAGLLGGPLALTLDARRDDVPKAGVGDTVTAGTIDELVARIPETRPGLSLVLFRNGLAVDRAEGTELRYDDPTAGTYRVEVWLTVPDLVYGEHVVPAAYSGRIRVAPAPTPVAGTKP